MNEHQKKFLSHLLKLTNETGFGQASVYADFAAAISGTIADTASSDTSHAEEQLTIRMKYTEAQFDVFQDMLACVSKAYQENPRQDFLGEIMVDQKLIADPDKENFIPYDVAELFAGITADDYRTQIEFGRHISIFDPYCATGATIIATLNIIMAQGIDYSKCAMCTCQATDKTVAQSCFIQLAIMGCAASVSVRQCCSQATVIPAPQGLFVPDDALCTAAFYDTVWHARRLSMINQFPID